MSTKNETPEPEYLPLTAEEREANAKYGRAFTQSGGAGSMLDTSLVCMWDRILRYEATCVELEKRLAVEQKHIEIMKAGRAKSVSLHQEKNQTVVDQAVALADALVRIQELEKQSIGLIAVIDEREAMCVKLGGKLAEEQKYTRELKERCDTAEASSKSYERSLTSVRNVAAERWTRVKELEKKLEDVEARAECCAGTVRCASLEYASDLERRVAALEKASPPDHLWNDVGRRLAERHHLIERVWEWWTRWGSRAHANMWEKFPRELLSRYIADPNGVARTIKEDPCK